MPNPHYRKGYIFELKVRDYFRNEGYEVFRSAGSHSPADLVIVTDHSLNFVQCKTTDRMTKKERQEFKDYCQRLIVQGIIASNSKGKIKLDYLSNN